MIRHIFLDKTATIIKNSETNTGLNPVVELNYGDAVTRIVLHFSEEQIKTMVEDKTIAQSDKVEYRLKMTNCTSINGVPYEKKLFYGNTSGVKSRASSFDILVMKLPQTFDEGRGYEFIDDTWIGDRRSFSMSGVNWFQSSNGKDWPEPGVYSPETIKWEYDKFSAGEESLVVARQHFDFGDENLDVDITAYVNSVLNGESNTGLLLCFTPVLEVLNGGAKFIEVTKLPEGVTAETYTEMPSTKDITVPDYFYLVDASGETLYKKTIPEIEQQYVGFFTDHTNTFFHPYLEVDYKEYIFDDRETFFSGKSNKLYLYSSIEGEPINLDEIPVCEIGNGVYGVCQVTKGVYCANVSLIAKDNQILYDVWRNLKYQGQDLGETEMEVVVLPSAKHFNVSSGSIKVPHIVPSVYGINDDENVSQEDVREIVVDFRKKYTTNERATTNKSFYRLYVKNGNQQIDILNGYQPIEHSFLHNYFILYAQDLVPGKYYVDIKVLEGREEMFYEDVLHFNIRNNVTERYA